LGNPVGWNEHPNPYTYHLDRKYEAFAWTSQVKLRESLGSEVCKAGMHKWRDGDICIKCDVIRTENPGYTKRVMPNRSR